MKKKLLSFGIVVVLLIASCLTLCSCGQSKSVDDQFLDSLAKGLEARWALTDKITNQAETKANWEAYFNAEYSEIKDYKDKSFENADLEKWAKAYITSIEESIDCLQYFGTNQWDSKFGHGPYQTRCEALYQINAIKPIPVKEDKKQTLQELLVNGEVSSMTSKLMKEVKFEKTKDEYGWKDYEAVVENTTTANFSYFQFNVALIDSSGVTVETAIAHVQNWNAGEKAKFTFGTNEDFEKMEIKSTEWGF